jgi:hypothetical protein
MKKNEMDCRYGSIRGKRDFGGETEGKKALSDMG